MHRRYMFQRLLQRQFSTGSSRSAFLQELELGTNFATKDEIKKAYRKLALIHHPDKGGCPKQFNKIQTAYDVLLEKEDVPKPQQKPQSKEPPKSYQELLAEHVRAKNFGDAEKCWAYLITSGLPVKPFVFASMSSMLIQQNMPNKPIDLIADAKDQGLFENDEAHADAFNEYIKQLSLHDCDIDYSMKAFDEMDRLGLQPDVSLMYETFRYFGGI